MKRAEFETLMKFFNSPFFLTLVSGLILSVASVILTDSLSQAAESRLRKEKDIAAQLSTHREFTRGMVDFVVNSHGMRKRGIWLYHMQSISPANRGNYPDGRDFEKTRDHYESQLLEFKKIEHAYSLCSLASSMFYSSDLLQTKIKKLRKTSENYLNTWDEDELNSLVDDIYKETEEIAAIMVQEIRK